MISEVLIFRCSEFSEYSKPVLNPFIQVIQQSLSEPHASLVSGIVFGIKSDLSRDFYEALIRTGTIHIVALSGQNISILIKLITELTLPLGRRVSLLFSFFGTLIFIVLVGFEPTIIRAAIMGSLSLIAVYFGKQNWSLLGLILAASLMLLINPDWIINISFQLSFLATLGIILFGTISHVKPKNIQEEFKRETIINLRTTLAAQVFTLPLIFWVFRRISLISPLSNLLISWLIGPIMTLGILTGLMGYIFLPLGRLMGMVLWPMTSYLIWVIEFTAKIPFASITF